MTAPITLKQLTTVALSAVTLFFCTFAVAEQSTPEASTAQKPAAQANETAPAVGGDLTFMDDQQTWRDSEISGYTEWLKRNPRYTHPIFQSQWSLENRSQFVDDQPDPNYRPWSYRQPWFNRGAVTNVRGRTLWVNDRYVTGKYYSSTGSQQPAASTTEPAQPKAETTAPAQGK